MLLFFIGLMAGILICAVILYFLTPRILLLENESRFNYQESLSKFESAVQKLGWKIPAKHNLRETMKKFGKKDVKDVMIYDICHPDLAEKILLTTDERIASTMMPCRVAIYEKNDGRIFCSRINSGLLLKTMGKVTRTQMSNAFRDTETVLGKIKI